MAGCHVRTLTDAPVHFAKVRDMADQLPHALRSDALDNRDRILDAARRLFSTEGLKVPMREIARGAGVGPATLYRRFPTKQALVAAVFADQVRECRAIVEEGCSDPDPWHGFCLLIEKTCEMHARDRGFTEAFLTAYPGATEIAEERAFAMKAVGELAQRAMESGRLRPDFVLDDILLMLMGNCGIRVASPAAQVAAARRFAAYVIQAFEARPQQAPLSAPVRLTSPAAMG
ncbi:TetR family transcriptional regulator [Streptomyces lasiicapitis]|uniref:TetR family transcriptional regulator n=2 Tax=Streptomyces lasiicapitis TaxID=1923961 RepID=A0ABQ2LJB1_9ACTN|nr:TetR family transcriptional regulator [Streptomyces lasiicapitis]